jgi:ABC-2 type transport system ATP-binding protein
LRLASEEDLTLVGEVAEEGPLGEAGAGGDVPGRGLVAASSCSCPEPLVPNSLGRSGYGYAGLMTSGTQIATGTAGLPDGEPGAVIHTEDLTKVYGGTDFTAVDKLNLDVEAGEIFGLLGPNGAGKTTTAGMLTTRVVPTSGRAFIAGVDVAAHPALAKQLSGIVSQQNTLDRQLTVWENLYFHGRLFGIKAKESKRIADELLAQFQLSRWAKASVYALSGGMAQRLMVARAIFHRPSVLFLDEPTAGLDPQSRLALWDVLGELNGEGQTIMLTTHYMEEAERLCDRVAIMDHGRVLALDTPAALKQSTGADTIVTVKATADLSRLAELLARDVEGVTRSRIAGDKLELHMRAGDRLVPRIVLSAEHGGFDLVDISVAEPSLETVFISLTGRELREE